MHIVAIPVHRDVPQLVRNNHCYTEAALRNTWLLAKAAAKYYHHHMSLPWGIRMHTTDILVFATYTDPPTLHNSFDAQDRHHLIYQALREAKTDLIPFLVIDQDKHGRPKPIPSKKKPGRPGPFGQRVGTSYPAPLSTWVTDPSTRTEKKEEYLASELAPFKEPLIDQEEDYILKVPPHLPTIKYIKNSEKITTWSMNTDEMEGIEERKIAPLPCRRKRFTTPTMPPPKEHLQMTPTHSKTPPASIPMDVEKTPTKPRQTCPSYPDNPKVDMTHPDPTVTFRHELVEGKKHG